jgi:maleylacetate reductase
MSLVFEHETMAQRVVFGSGRAAGHLRAEVVRLGSATPLVIAGPRHGDLIARAGLAAATRYSRTVEHVPIDVAVDARSVAKSSGCDLVIAVGGGSATGLAKAVALTSGLPIVAVPTTFAGSEATDLWGVTEDGRKRTGTDAKVLPVTVIYDAELLADLPVEFAVASGLNAVAHCVDSMWGPRADPISSALAMEGLRTLGSGLPGVAARKSDATELALYGCYLAAVALASAGAGLHHKICHVLGGSFDLPHAATHAIVLAHVLAFNAPHAPAAVERIATALGSSDASDGLDRLRTGLHAPTALRDVGFQDDDIPAAAMLILAEVPSTNPRPVDGAALTTLLQAAWAGSDTRLT